VLISSGWQCGLPGPVSSCPGLATLARDFWLFDAGTARPLMNYDQAGEYLGAVPIAEPVARPYHPVMIWPLKSDATNTTQRSPHD
jgi:hypothetical protein